MQYVLASQRHIRVTHNPWVVGSSPTRPTRRKHLVNVIFLATSRRLLQARSCRFPPLVAQLWHYCAESIGHRVQLVGNKLA